MTSGGVFTNYHFYWDSSNNTWNDVQGTDTQGASGTADPVSFSYSATPVVNGTIITGIGGAGADFIFTMSGIVSTEPNVLTHTNSALYGSYEWRYHSQTATHYLYGMYHIGNDAFFDVPTSLIQVGKSGQSDYNTWSMRTH